MVTGIFISFVSLFLVLTTVTYNLGNYFKPLGFEYDDVWYLHIDWKEPDADSKIEPLRQIENALQSYPEIENFSYSVSYLFMPAVMSTNEFEYAGKTISSNVMQAGDQFAEVLSIDLVQGRWFGPEDNVTPALPVVINEHMAEEFFPGENPVGKIILRDEDQCKVVGVIGEFRNGGEFTGSKKVVIKRSALANEFTREFLQEDFFIRILLKVRPGTRMDFEERMLKQVSSIARDWVITAGQLETTRESANKQSMIVPVIMAIICGFLVINVALGLFGIIWYNTNRRRAEIGLRRAMGSTIRQIYKQIIGESMVLSTFGILAGIFIAVQFPVLELIPFISNGVYLVAILATTLFIYLMTVVCALYPSRLASGIEPAIALHEE